MNIELPSHIRVSAEYLKVSAGVRYWEDAKVNGVEDADGTLIPIRNGDAWEPVIDIASGLVLDWPAGTTADIHYKVCDAGIYQLLNYERQVVAEYAGYVPDCLSPQESGFGDYIILKIGPDGAIEGWKPMIDAPWEAA